MSTVYCLMKDNEIVGIFSSDYYVEKALAEKMESEDFSSYSYHRQDNLSLTPEKAVELLNKLDPKQGDEIHQSADMILIAVLRHLGQNAVINAYKQADDKFHFTYSF